MSENDISGLVEFGLTVLQAKTYVTLLRLDTARASQLSSTMDMVRPEVYRLLRELSNKGLIQRNLGYPWTYSAIPPERALYLLMRRHREHLLSLTQEKANLVKSLSCVTPVISRPNQELSVIRSEKEDLNTKLKQMIEQAKDDYVGIHSKYGLSEWLDQNLARSIVLAKRRKLRIRLIAEMDETNAKVINFLSRHIEVKFSKDLLFYMDIVDGKEMLFGPVFPLTDAEARKMDQKDLDLSTSNTTLVRAMYGIFDKLWESSTKYIP